MDYPKFTTKELKNEIWKDIPGFKGYYQVSNLGKVKRLEIVREINWRNGSSAELRKVEKTYPEKPLRPRIGSHGYPNIIFYIGNKRKCFTIHRLVYMAFCGKIEFGKEINHKNGNKLDSRLANLEQMTKKENSAHARYVLNILPQGENHAWAKLRDADILEIRRLWDTGEYKQIELADKYNVVFQHISKIVNRETWKHI